MTPDELKNTWRQSGAADPSSYGRPVGDAEIDRITSGRITGARDRLMRQYRLTFLFAPAAGILCQLPLLGTIPLWISLAFILFFIIAGGMDYYLWRGIRSIDLDFDGVEEVARKARFYRRRHHQFQLLLIPAAVVIITAFALSAAEVDIHMVYGIIAGIVIGLPLGLTVYFRMMRNYRSMM